MANHSFNDVQSLERAGIMMGFSFTGDPNGLTSAGVDAYGDAYGAGMTYTSTGSGQFTVTLDQPYREVISVVAGLELTTPAHLIISTKFPVAADRQTIIIDVINSAGVPTNLTVNDRVNLLVFARNTSDGVI